jgi:TorA maturation chaperone TorD
MLSALMPPGGRPTRSGRARSLELRDLGVLRGEFYRLFATLLLYPRSDRFLDAWTLARALARRNHVLAAFAFYSHWGGLHAALEALAQGRALDGSTLGPGGGAALEDEFTRLFLAGSQAPPNESAYAPAHTTGWLLAELAREYAACGLVVVSPSGEGPDAAPVELEFMAYLCQREADAWARRAGGQARGVLTQEQHFLTRHLARWIPLFARRVAHATPEGFYARAADAVSVFVLHDRSLVEALCARLAQ